jgi:hypothetical protein
MRGLKVRSADTLHEWSSAILLDTAPGGVRAYVDAQSLLKLSLAGGTLTGPLNLPGDAVNILEAVPLGQVQELISTAVNALIGSAPATLDTLQEIAAALNNNPDAVSAITTQLTDKASLTTGATFVGAVNVPTVANGDNSTAAASTAWVLANAQAIDPALTNLVGLSTTGFITRVVGGGYATRTIVGTVGRIGVTNGDGLSLDPTIDLAPSGVTPGDYTKVTVDAFGRVTGGVDLVDLDLPSITPNAGSVFAGTPISITNAINSLQSAIAAAAGSADGAEDIWTADGVQTVFNFTNIDGSLAAARTYRVLVFVDGSRQPRSAYTISSTGVTFATPPSASVEIEAIQIA